MHPQTEKLIKEITEIIVQAVDPKQVILFGSQVRGEAREESDLDFLVVQDHTFGPGHTRSQEMTKLWRLLAHFPVSQDILVCTPKEMEKWRQSKNHVIARALREGKVLYERT